jgi:anti-anti-sigma factor
MNMPLDIHIQEHVSGSHAGAITVKLNGSLDKATAPTLERVLNPLLASPVTHLIFDLADLHFVSSAGLRVFASTRKPLHSRNGNASIVNAKPQIQEIFNIIHLLPGLSVFTNIAEMDQYLAARRPALAMNT